MATCKSAKRLAGAENISNGDVKRAKVDERRSSALRINEKYSHPNLEVFKQLRKAWR